MFLERGRKSFPINDESVLEGYKQYFGFAPIHLDKTWTPNSAGGTCRRILYHISKGNEKYFPLGRGEDLQSVTKPVSHFDSPPKLKLVVAGPSSGMKRQRTLESKSQWGGESEAGKPH